MEDAVELSGVELGSSGRVAYVYEATSAAKISVTHRGTSLKANPDNSYNKSTKICYNQCSGSIFSGIFIYIQNYRGLIRIVLSYKVTLNIMLICSFIFMCEYYYPSIYLSI